MSSECSTALLPATRRLMTAEEYYRMPVGPPYSQLVEGELIMSPSPNYFHQKIIGRFHLSLGNFLEKKPLGEVILSPSDVELDDENIYQPDLYYVSKARLSLFTKQVLQGAPDFVVEVLSASTARLDLGKKKAHFATSGVQEFWAVVPDRKVVEVWNLMEPAKEPAARFGVGQVLSTAVLPGWKLPVTKIFEGM